MADSWILDRLKAVKNDLIVKGADPGNLAMVMSDLSYNKLHKTLQNLSGKEILILEKFENMEIIVHPSCDDDQIHIIDKNVWKVG